ncbi:glutathione S-transferase [Azospira oryzae PS]|jgi:glutathione S-transferase|uniref:Glutathione S-transferase n=2 Tax=Azospira oryzae TaxID=146939 RepID=G8QGL5_AZOOP|nr:glutathione S-transferase [Azospira oryzae PS]RZT76565.1 glutathione S-transferase [Azospira oryzae]BBN89230.1 glutathione S-transferase [Azospira sp. I09]
MLQLVIGNKNFSSWSLRPWLLLKQAGLPFREIPVRLRQADTKAQILAHSPSGKVPALIDGDLTVWDSLAICEYLAEKASLNHVDLWPADPKARAEARSVSAEMHSGFAALRQQMSMEVAASRPGEGQTPEVLADIARIAALWTSCRERFAAAGPFLFGDFSVADAMYAPVAFRFHTYGVELPPLAAAYRDTLLALPAMQEWAAGARAEVGA